MTDFDPEKFRAAIYGAKLMVYMVVTANPEKQITLDKMKRIVDELVDCCDELLED